jgi:hypothetical protein
MENQQSEDIYYKNNILAELLFYEATDKSKERSKHREVSAQLD